MYGIYEFSDVKLINQMNQTNHSKDIKQFINQLIIYESCYFIKKYLKL